jgi:hypothetical protein
MRRSRLTLPIDLLSEAQRIARARMMSLSTVIAEAVSAGLRLHAAPERSEEVLIGYKKAFAGLSRADVAILDGVILESPARH